MIGKENLVALLESSSGQRSNPGRLVRHVYEGLGLADANGRRHLTPAGNPDWQKVMEARKRNGYLPNEFSLLELANVVIGEDWQRRMSPNAVAQAALMESQTPLLEAGTGAVTPTDFINVNAFTAVVTGLYEVALLEGFNKLEFIADRIAPADPTKTFGGKKVIGAGGIGNKSEIRKPGMPTHRSGLTERWINTPATDERADSIEILQETIYLDQTGDVTSKANDIGYWLGYQKDIRCIDCFIGVTTATQYNYKGTTYNTYIDSSGSGYVYNDFSNELVHWSNYEQTLLKFREMVDPETSTRVTIRPNLVVVNMEKLVTARAIFGDLAGRVEYRDPASTTVAMNLREMQSPYKGQVEILESPLVYERCIAADGLALSATNAGKYWWATDTTNGGHVRYAQNWPLRVQQATPTQMDMVDRGVVMFIKADERGEPYVREIRKSVRNKN
jgi:hypothetical protein